MTPNARQTTVTRWLARAAFFASTLALLGTSRPPRWRLDGSITEPRAAPSDRALVVAIEASAAPELHVSGTAFSEREAFPCATRQRCLLPPGATLTSVLLDGPCGGCSGHCGPPPGAFVRATTSLEPVFTSTATMKADATLPRHGKDRIASAVTVKVAGAELVDVTLHVEPRKGNSTVADAGVSDQRLLCRQETCWFLLFDDLFHGPTDVTLVATATGFGTSQGAVRVASIEVADP